jgi:NAD(P)-dependent dehydrogenase (short-subunit alcohol dehydrogenase family)
LCTTFGTCGIPITARLTCYSGIGLETCILFAREGANVLLSDISGPALEKALAKVKEIVPSAKQLDARITDVSKEADVQAMIEHVDSWGGVDVLFNNAGIMHADDDDAVNTPEKIWDLTQAINVKGVWFGSKFAVLSLRKHGKKKGSIINTASVVALVGSATPQLAYTASKGAVLALTRELAMVHAREGYRFNALCPAPLKYASLASPLQTLTNTSQHTPPPRLARRRCGQAPPPRSPLPDRPIRRGRGAGAGRRVPCQ